MATKKSQPKPRCSGTLTESAYLAWIRSLLRKGSLRWKPRNEALLAARRKYHGPNTRQLWEYKCDMCGEYFSAKEVVVDHFPHAAGSILSVEDIGPFAERLFCEVRNLRVLDKVCHDAHTYAEANGVSLEEAKLQKRVVETLKDKQKTLALLSQAGYTSSQISNETKRRAALIGLFNKEK